MTDQLKAVLNNIGAVSLGPRIERDEFESVVAATLLQWKLVYPEVFSLSEVEVEFELEPIAVVFTPRAIVCSHVDSPYSDVTIPMCDGLWYTSSKYLFVRFEKTDQLKCTSVGHELGHMLSLMFLGTGDHAHENVKVWRDIVGALQHDCK